MIETSLPKLRVILIQCLAVTLLIYVILVCFKTSDGNVLIAAIGSSCFTIFATPTAEASKSKNVLGGYLIGISIGVLCYYFKEALPTYPYFTEDMLIELASAIAIGGAIFVMLLFGYEHPPAVGAALSLVVYPWGWRTIIAMLVLVVILLASKYLIRNYLKHLAHY